MNALCSSRLNQYFLAPLFLDLSEPDTDIFDLVQSSGLLVLISVTSVRLAPVEGFPAQKFHPSSYSSIPWFLVFRKRQKVILTRIGNDPWWGWHYYHVIMFESKEPTTASVAWYTPQGLPGRVLPHVSRHSRRLRFTDALFYAKRCSSAFRSNIFDLVSPLDRSELHFKTRFVYFC